MTDRQSKLLECDARRIVEGATSLAAARTFTILRARLLFDLSLRSTTYNTTRSMARSTEIEGDSSSGQNGMRRRLPSHSSGGRPREAPRSEPSAGAIRKRDAPRDDEAIEGDKENRHKKKRRKTGDGEAGEAARNGERRRREEQEADLDEHETPSSLQQSSHSESDDQNSSEAAEEQDVPEAEGTRSGEEPTQQVDQSPIATSQSHMSPQERIWYAMSFEELYQHAKKKDFGKSGKEGRKTGCIQIIKWLCNKAGITPYVAPSITPVEAAPIIDVTNMRDTGAISHPEAILRTSDPALQGLIDEAEKSYSTWSAADLLELCMQRSYQLLKDDKGKLPSKSKSAI